MAQADPGGTAVARWITDPNDDNWQAVHRLTLPLIRRVIKRRLQRGTYGLRLSAPDLESVALLKAFTGVRTYDPKAGKWSTWVGRIADNVVTDAVRRGLVRVADPLSETTAQAVEKSGVFGDAEVRAYHEWIALPLTDATVKLIADAWVAYQGTASPAAVRTVIAALDNQKVNWAIHGEATSLVAGLFAVVRVVLHADDDLERAEEALPNYSDTTPFGVFARMVGYDAAAKLVIIAGGSRMSVPGLGEIIARRTMRPT